MDHKIPILTITFIVGALLAYFGISMIAENSIVGYAVVLFAFLVILWGIFPTVRATRRFY